MPNSRPQVPPAPDARSQRSDDTRRELLLAAERLFALHGLKGVSLRQIVAATRQRNISTVHYHFGSREALAFAICDLRMPPIEARRSAQIALFLDHPPVPAERVRELMRIAIEPSLEPILASRGCSHFRRLLAHAFVSDVVDLRAYIEGRYDLAIRQTASLVRQELPHLSRESFATRWALLIRAVTYLLANLETRAELVSWRKSQMMLKSETTAMAAAFAGFFTAPEDGRTEISKSREKSKEKVSNRRTSRTKP